MSEKIDFDFYADSYDRALAEGLAVSGENREYFAEGRVKWLAGRLHRMGSRPLLVIDFGCGTGSTSPILLEFLRPNCVIGLDSSARSIDVARRKYASERIHFSLVQEYEPSEAADLIYCNGVFHHIPPELRGSSLKFLHQALRPGGLFSLWENNPWNPGTRFIMSRIPFDRDAVTLSPLESRSLVRSEGFSVVRTDFVFFFPRFLKLLRPTEKLLSRVPLGAQYQVVCQKSGA